MPYLTPNIHQQDYVNHCVAQLAACDEDIAQILPQLGEIKVRKGDLGFQSFCDIIISQQLSNKAADTIFKRFQQLLNHNITPDAILSQNEADLKACGLSQNKYNYLISLANDVKFGYFNPDNLHQYNDVELIKVISARKGLGIWSAEIYAMFSLGRTDIMPAGDLALQHGLRILKNLPAKPTDKELRAQTNHWQPHRSVGSLILWQLYSAKGSATGSAKGSAKGTLNS